jgi:hypothetical protein
MPQRSYHSSEEFSRSLEPSYAERPVAQDGSLNAAAQPLPPAKRPLLERLQARRLAPHHQPVIGAQHHPHAHHAVAPDGSPNPAAQVSAQNAAAQPLPPGPPLIHPHHARRRSRFETFSALYLFLMLVMVMVIAAKTESSSFIVLLTFLPTIFTVVIALIIYEAAKDNKNLLWGVPFILVFLFNWYGKNNGGIIANVNVEGLTALNLLFSFLYLIVLSLAVDHASRPKPAPKQAPPPKKKLSSPEDLSHFIASIEDKGKALNFVIGRVYNAYHGGSKELRERINMKQEWYDQFSQLPRDPAKIDFKELGKLIMTIEARLKLLAKPEVEVFGLAHLQFRNLVRDASGNEPVLEVLAKNDKDPVKSYVEGALDFCGEIRAFIARRESPGVQNEYVDAKKE